MQITCKCNLMPCCLSIFTREFWLRKVEYFSFVWNVNNLKSSQESQQSIGTCLFKYLSKSLSIVGDFAGFGEWCIMYYNHEPVAMLTIWETFYTCGFCLKQLYVILQKPQILKLFPLATIFFNSCAQCSTLGLGATI